METININERIINNLINEVKSLKLQVKEIKGEKLTGSIFEFWDNEQDERWNNC